MEGTGSERGPWMRPDASSADFGWLAEVLWERIAALRHYPYAARVNHLEGQVILRVVVVNKGDLKDIRVVESSGHAVLDGNALDVVRRAFPLNLTQNLQRPEVVVQIPIDYRLKP